MVQMIYQLDQYHLLYLKPETCERRAIFSGNTFFFPLTHLQCALQSCNTAVYWKDPLLIYLNICQATCKLFSIHGLFSCLQKRDPPEWGGGHRLLPVQLYPYRWGDTPGELTCNNWITLPKIEEPGCWKWMHRWCFGGLLLYYLLSLFWTVL